MRRIAEGCESLEDVPSMLRAVADKVDELLTKVEAGEEEHKYASDGKVVADREMISPNPSDDVEDAVKIIKLSLRK